MKLFYSGMCIVAFLAVTACHKDKKVEIIDKQLTMADAGSTVSVTKGETISLTLSNPGDGGYTLNDPQYKNTVLTLVSHTQQGGDVNKIGDFGSDTWKFTASENGTTTLEITANRGVDKISLFANQITVK